MLSQHIGGVNFSTAVDIRKIHLQNENTWTHSQVIIKNVASINEKHKLDLVQYIADGIFNNVIPVCNLDHLTMDVMNSTEHNISSLQPHNSSKEAKYTE